MGFSVYVHVPFCSQKCGYCDFYSIAVTNGHFVNSAPRKNCLHTALRDNYVKTILREIDLWKYELSVNSKSDYFDGKTLKSIFFGGGTPSLLDASDIKTIIDAIKTNFSASRQQDSTEFEQITETRYPLAPNEPTIEISVEANPDTLTWQYLCDLRAIGVNRLSIGMQSNDIDVLETLQRTHSPHQVELAMGWANKLGFKTSLDLIYGTPGETLNSWKETLLTALDYRPDHISCYALTLEKNVPIAHLRKFQDEECQAEMYIMADEILSENGYEWYEISNWRLSKKGIELDENIVTERYLTLPPNSCLHNLNYWLGGDWIGLGPSAHGSIGDFRYGNIASLGSYNSSVTKGDFPFEFSENLTEDEKRTEKIMLNLRLKTGLSLKDVFDFGLDEIISDFIKDGLLERVEGNNPAVCSTLRGRLLGDFILGKIV